MCITGYSMRCGGIEVMSSCDLLILDRICRKFGRLMASAIGRHTYNEGMMIFRGSRNLIGSNTVV